MIRPLRCFLLALVLAVPGASAQQARQANPQVTTRTAPARPGAAVKPAFLLHIPGIGGTRGIDQTLVTGLFAGGAATRAVLFDWTENDPGIDALVALDRNRREAQEVADLIVRQRRRQPKVPILLTSHSGGAGIMAWALEDLPAGVTVETAVFLAPALSPGYDLSRALKHVTGEVYVFWSPRDSAVLGTGTEIFGTMDRVNTAAAGNVDFLRPGADGTAVATPSTRPAGLAEGRPIPSRVVRFADPGQYAKLISVPYDPAWRRFSNNGSHLGPMRVPFAQNVLAPLLTAGKLPEVKK